jgi:hypothetical protein
MEDNVAKRGRKKQVPWRQSWKVIIYRPHSSGIGAHYLRTEIVYEKPSFETGFYMDETNHMWAIDENTWFLRHISRLAHGEEK